MIDLEWIKKNKLKIIITSVIICIISVTYYLHSHRPVFSATHKLEGTDEKRVLAVETKVPAGSLVTMYKDKVFVMETVASKDSIVTTNLKEVKKADKSGTATFRILPNQLRHGINKIHFEVKAPPGLKRSFYYPLDKSKIPPTLKLNITDHMVNNENMKKVVIITDPLNTITIQGLVNNMFSKDGQEEVEIKNTELLGLLNMKPEDLPDDLDTSIQVSVTDVDRQTKTEIYPVTISTLTNLTVNPPAETEADLITIKGQASPGAYIIAGGDTVWADDRGNFKLDFPLPSAGEHLLKLNASRPGEKPAEQDVAINRLLPAVSLSVETPASLTNNGQDLAIEGTTTPGATVTVNGDPAEVSYKKFKWLFKVPAGVSKDYTLTIKAEKEGYRSSEQTLIIPRTPVYRDSIPE